jgi:hypothetical protein
MNSEMLGTKNYQATNFSQKENTVYHHYSLLDIYNCKQ